MPQAATSADDVMRDREFRARVREAMGLTHPSVAAVCTFCAPDAVAGFQKEALLLVGRPADAPVTRLEVGP